jgi:hypothetical protein
MFVAVVLTACHAQTVPWPVGCPPTAPSGARIIASDSVAQLAGTYDLVMVGLSRGAPAWITRGRFNLSVADTLYRYWVWTIRGSIRRGDRPLVGKVAFFDSAGAPGPPEPADVEDGVLYLGCRQCTDASPLELRLIAETPVWIWGLWEDEQTGIGRLIDASGNWAPNPAGYFCARRLQ